MAGAAVVGLLALVAIVLVVQHVRGGGGGGGQPWDDQAVAALEARGAAGFSHVVYANSPGGAAESASRVLEWEPAIERAVAGTSIPPDLLAAIVYLESAGRPDVIAGADQDPANASGLTQILAETGTGFLGMQIDLEKSRTLTAQIAAAEAGGDTARADRLRTQRAAIDDRFDPDKALAATVRYLQESLKRFGRLDLAVTSYHMGIGNLSNAVRAYAGAGDDVATADIVRHEDLSYAKLYFNTSPLQGQEAWKVLSALSDDSANYWWKVLACREILRLAQVDPKRLTELERLQAQADSGAKVLHPSVQVDKGAATPQITATMDWIQGTAAKIAPKGKPLTVLGTAGWQADVSRKYGSQATARAFQFTLDRLQALNLIAWERQQERIVIVASEEATADGLKLADDPGRAAPPAPSD